MCGRYTLTMEAALLAKRFGIVQLRIPMTPRYNIAPSQMVPTVLTVGEAGEKLTVLDGCSWGLTAPPKPGTKAGKLIINARMEGLFERSMFKKLVEIGRCLIPADGFYSWATEGKRKVPYLVRLKGGQPFFFAGLWKQITDSNKQKVKACVIITVPANDTLSEIEERMPAILRTKDEKKWLNPEMQDKAEIIAMLSPYPDKEIEYFKVSKLVNSSKVDDEACARPLTESEDEKEAETPDKQMSLFDLA